MRWPPKVLRLLAALLLSRKLYATYDGRVIGPRQATVGLAQGSVLSPILYILYTSGISRNLPQAVTSLKFADDETLLARGPDLLTVLRTLQDGLQILADNLREGGVHLSPTKSTLCIFTRRRVPAVRDRIILDGVPLPESTEARCLGLIFDSKLTWNAHIRHVKQRCSGVLSFMRTIAHTSWGTPGAPTHGLLEPTEIHYEIRNGHLRSPYPIRMAPAGAAPERSPPGHHWGYAIFTSSCFTRRSRCSPGTPASASGTWVHTGPMEATAGAQGCRTVHPPD